jgi:hypothetical protein
MIPSVLFKQAVVWGVGAQTGAYLVQGTGAAAKAVYNKLRKNKDSTT